MVSFIFFHSHIHTLAIALTNSHSLPHARVSQVAVPFDVFMNKVAVKIPDKWKQVGTQMNLTPAKIDAIDQQYNGNPDDCYRKVFREWSPYGTQTWSQLLAILRTDHVAEMVLAQEIEAGIESN